MNKAFAELFGIPDAFDDIQMAGGLDLHFIHFAFQKHHLDTARLPEFLERYYRALEEELRSGHTELLPGVKEILQRIDQQAGLYNCLGTGNLEKGARIKLDLFDLNRYFPVGGFCDSLAERYQVLQNGVERASAYYKTDFAPSQTVVIGDTVKDIEAAKKMGATVIAVATGGNSYEMLQAAQPDHLLNDLSDTELFFSLIKKRCLQLPTGCSE